MGAVWNQRGVLVPREMSRLSFEKQDVSVLKYVQATISLLSEDTGPHDHKIILPFGISISEKEHGLMASPGKSVYSSTAIISVQIPASFLWNVCTSPGTSQQGNLRSQK